MSIADFLFTPAQQRILRPLLLNPDKVFTLSDLIVLSASGNGAGQRQVDGLVKAGVLTQEHFGNRRHIQANTDFPLYPELRSICLKSFGLKDVLVDALAPVAKQITQSFIFGSFAKGTDGPSSDIDLLVIGSIDLIQLLDLIVPVEAQIGRTIDVNLRTDEEWSKLIVADSVFKYVAEGPKVLVIGEGSDQ